MTLKSDLISAIQLAKDETLAFAGELSEKERSTAGQVDRWEARDVLAHLAYSVQEMARNLNAARGGEKPPAGKSNVEVYHLYRDRPWEDVFDLLLTAYPSLIKQVQPLSDTELSAPAEWLNGRLLWRAIAGAGFLHPVVHLAQTLIERGERERALRLNDRATVLAERLETDPDWQGMIQYNTGCFYALMGEKQLALENLEKGFRLSPRMIDFSMEDPDLVSLQEDADFQALQERFRA